MSSFDILSLETPLHHRLFLEASAGTGKTFTIEHLVVRLLLETQLNLEQILVVTFTRAATRELKVRIRENLQKILENNASFDYLKNIDEAQKNKIKAALLNFEQAQIFTIHGFCHRILQEFAFEALVGLELQEWDEREERWAILEFLRSTKVLTPHQLQRLIGSMRNDIEQLVDKLASSSDEKPPQLKFSLPAPFPLVDTYQQIHIHYKGMTSPDFILQAELLEKVLARGEFLPEEWDHFIGQEELFLEGISSDNLKARSKFQGSPEMEQLRKRLLPALEAARNPKKIFALLSHAWHQEKQKISRLQEKISPDDLLQMVQEKLSELKFISEIQKKYQAVIVDEFQDTDPVQWKIFNDLFFSDVSKSVYLVGDPKQSIYAFRNADIYTFLNASQGFMPEQKAMLTTNYRSTRGLIDALNRLFCHKPWIDLPKLNQHLLVPLTHAAREGEGELCFMVARGDLGRSKRWPTPEIEDRLFFFIVHEITRLNLQPSQIAVLVKDRYQALRLKNSLQKWRVPSVLYRSASLGDSIVVALLEEVIQACQGLDSRDIKKVLVGPFFKVDIEAMTDEVVLEAKAFFADLALTWLEQGFPAFLAQFLKNRPVDSLYDDLMQIVEKIAYIQDPHQMLKALERLKIEESDDRISARPQGIQILTTHASKGLEFDTVFALGLASRTSPDDNGNLQEIDAEKMRQLYVALTRAKTRLYIPLLQEGSGKIVPLGQASPMELFWQKTLPDLTAFHHVDLNELAFNLQPFEEEIITPPEIFSAQNRFFKPLFLQSFSSMASPSILHPVRLSEFRPAATLPNRSSSSAVPVRELTCFATRRSTGPSRVFSSPAREWSSSVGAQASIGLRLALPKFTQPDRAQYGEKKNIPETLIPAGTETGLIVHRILEKWFDQAGPLEELIVQEIVGTNLEDFGDELCTMIERVLDLPLSNFCLRDVDPGKLMTEMEFVFPTATGFIKGFIDLCFEHQGKTYLVDWKTNVLADYTLESLQKAMSDHDYFLQGQIYATALERYTKLHEGLNFGGVFFVFVRGPALISPEALNA